jgi:hypothetical protein
MKRNWLKFTAALFIGAMIFTSCDKEVTLTAPPDATIDLGDAFDEKAGLIVDGAKVEDVNVLWNPTFNNELVDHYVFTYTVEGVSDTRNVYVRADKLAKIYAVVDQVDGGDTYNYPVTVSRGTEFNELRFNELFYPDIIVNGVVNGSVITIPAQNFYGGEVNIQGTGTYDGAAQKILQVTYTLKETGFSDLTGTVTFD